MSGVFDNFRAPQVTSNVEEDHKYINE